MGPCGPVERANIHRQSVGSKHEIDFLAAGSAENVLGKQKASWRYRRGRRLPWDSSRREMKLVHSTISYTLLSKAGYLDRFWNPFCTFVRAFGPAVGSQTLSGSLDPGLVRGELQPALSESGRAFSRQRWVLPVPEGCFAGGPQGCRHALPPRLLAAPALGRLLIAYTVLETPNMQRLECTYI